MKITTTRNIDSNLGGLETHRVSIAANGKAFSTLVKGIYENKIRAFVREISTNALDSHIEAGIADTPFHVSFPDVFDPYFRVRDYGVSMTHEQVFAIFGTLFESTKDQSNDVVGAFGLGSKSPLAYADSFNVTAFLNGEMRVYLVTIDETGAPTISLLTTEATDKPDGIEVAVPVREADFSRVIDEGRSVLSAFDVTPTNNVGVEPMERIYTIADGSGFVIKSNGGYYGGVEVRQGCVMYPVNDWEITRGVTCFNGGYRLVLDVPIGTVGVTTSREALELDEATRAEITNRVNAAVEAIRIDVNSQFDSFPNFLEATRHYVNNNIDSFWGGTVSYKEKPLTGWIDLDPYKASQGKAYRAWYNEMVPTVKGGNKRQTYKMRNVGIRDAQKFLFIVERSDKKVTRGGLRYREAVEANGQNHTFLLTDPSPRLISRLYRLLGLRSDQIVSIASLPDPGPAKRGERKATNSNVSGVTTTAYYNNEVKTLPEDYYWIEITRPSQWDRSSANRLRNEVINDGGDDLPLLIFSPTAKKRYKPEADREVHTARKVALESVSDDIAEAYKMYTASNGLSHIVLDAVEFEGFNDDLAHRAAYVFDADQMEALRGEGESIRRDWKRRFPLLIDPTDADWAAYIAAQSAESE